MVGNILKNVFSLQSEHLMGFLFLVFLEMMVRCDAVWLAVIIKRLS